MTQNCGHNKEVKGIGVWEQKRVSYSASSSNDSAIHFCSVDFCHANNLSHLKSVLKVILQKGSLLFPMLYHFYFYSTISGHIEVVESWQMMK